MKNKDEFKVMPWLRAVRERNAREAEGLTPAEIMALSQKRKKVVPVRYIVKNFEDDRVIHSVAESKGKYTRKKN